MFDKMTAGKQLTELYIQIPMELVQARLAPRTCSLIRHCLSHRWSHTAREPAQPSFKASLSSHILLRILTHHRQHM